MADSFKNVQNQMNPATKWVQLTASATPLAWMPRWIICTSVGNITVVDAAGASMTLTALPVNTPLYIRPYKVTAVTGTFYGLY